MVTRDQIVDECRSFKGVRYLHQGTTTYGIDCRGILIAIAKKFELTDHNLDDSKFICYPTSPVDNTFQSILEEYCKKIDIQDSKEGDILLFKFNKEAQHMAFITEVLIQGTSWNVVHSTQKLGVAEHEIGPRWLKLMRAEIVGCYTLPIE